METIQIVVLAASCIVLLIFLSAVILYISLVMIELRVHGLTLRDIAKVIRMWREGVELQEKIEQGVEGTDYSSEDVKPEQKEING